MQINLTSYLFTDCFRDVLMCDSFIQINRVFNNKTECIIILGLKFRIQKRQRVVRHIVLIYLYLTQKE